MNIEVKYFKAERINGKIAISGQESAFFGYSIVGDIKPSGVWAKWEYSENQLKAENDRFGYYPLFYLADSGKFIISNSILKLIAEGADSCLDKAAISVFCRCGFFLGESTPFEKIKVLRPNAQLIWRDGVLNLSGGIQFVKSQQLNTDQAVDGYIEYFRKAIGKIASKGEEFVLPLSGGCDSRQILFELMRLGLRPSECITCGESRDTKVASLITERFGLKHKIIKKDNKWTYDARRKNVRTHFCAMEHAWLMGLGDYLNNNCRISYDGIGVGIFTRSELILPELNDLYLKGRYEDIARWLFKRVGPGQDFLNMLSGKFKFVADYEDEAISLVADELKRHSGAANPLTSFNFWNWNRRAIALNPFGIQTGLERNYAPFLDGDLFDFTASFSFELITKKEPQLLAIKRAFPEYADIPFYKDVEKDPPERKSRLAKLDGFLSTLLMTAGYDLSMVPVIAKAKLFRHSAAAGKDLNKFVEVATYLSQLQYCRDSSNAKKEIANNF